MRDPCEQGRSAGRNDSSILLRPGAETQTKTGSLLAARRPPHAARIFPGWASHWRCVLFPISMLFL